MKDHLALSTWPVTRAELVRIATHEAGHATVFEVLQGFDATIDIWVNASGLLDGRCTHSSVVSPLARAAVSLAGAAAEVIGMSVPFPNERAFFDAMRLRASASDVCNAGRTTDYEYRVAYGMCLKYWNEIVARARREIEIFNRRAAVVEALAPAY